MKSEAHLCVQSSEFSGSVTACSLHGTSCPLDLQARCTKENSNKFSAAGTFISFQKN